MDLHQTVSNYLDNGWQAVPVPTRSKAPVHGWPNIKIKHGDIPSYFDNKHQNVSIVLGEASGGLVDIDLDCPEAIKLAPLLLPSTCSFGRASTPKAHYIYKVDPICFTKQYKDVNSEMLIELRSSSKEGKSHVHTVFPPSIHEETGEVISWTDKDNIAPTILTGEKLVEHVNKLSAATLLARHWPIGSRHKLCMYLAGGLLKKDVFNLDDTIRFIQNISEVADNGCKDSKAMNEISNLVRTTHRKLNDGEKIAGFYKASEIVGKEVLKKFLIFLGIQDDKSIVIEEMNEQYCIASEGGKVFVFKEDQDQDLNRKFFTPFTFEEFSKNFIKEYVTVLGKNGKPTSVNKGTYWLKHKDGRQYDGLKFQPGNEEKEITGPNGETYLNLWRGWGCESKKGDWPEMEYHLKEIISKGDEIKYKYLLDWIAFMFQYPMSPAESVIVLKSSAKGTGKGTVGALIGEILGQHFTRISSPDQLVGKFNAHLRDTIFLVADEVLWGGNRADTNKLKSIITEETLPVEAKYRDTITTKNMLHILMTTNETWAIPAEDKERRYAVYEVSIDKAVDIEYFEKLRDAWHNGEREAFFYDMLNREVSAKDIKVVPKTPELTEQIIRSLNKTSKWWYELLSQGFIRMDMDGTEVWGPYESEAVLYDSFLNHLQNSGMRKYKGTKNEVLMELKRYVPEKSLRKVKIKYKDGTFGFALTLDSLEDCRKHFADFLGCDLEWEDEIEVIDESEFYKVLTKEKEDNYVL